MEKHKIINFIRDHPHREIQETATHLGVSLVEVAEVIEGEEIDLNTLRRKDKQIGMYFAKQLHSLFSKIAAYYEDNQTDIELCNDKKNDFNHAIELVDYENERKIDIFNNMKDMLNKRRSLKNQNKILKPLYKVIKENEDILADIQRAYNKQEGVLDYVDNRAEYNPRVKYELFPEYEGKCQKEVLKQRLEGNNATG